MPSGNSESGSEGQHTQSSLSGLEKEISDKFSQRWEVYRIATHEKGGIEMALDMSWKYSTKQLFEILEILDVYDALKKMAHEKALVESKTRK